MHITEGCSFTLPVQWGARLEMPTGIYGRCGWWFRCENRESGFCITPYCFVLRKVAPLLPRIGRKALGHKGKRVVSLLRIRDDGVAGVSTYDNMLSIPHTVNLYGSIFPLLAAGKFIGLADTWITYYPNRGSNRWTRKIMGLRGSPLTRRFHTVETPKRALAGSEKNWAPNINI